MSEQGVEAFRADRDEVLAVARSLSGTEWGASSDCAGWRVQDVIAHMANVCRTVVDPSTLPPGVPGDLEATQAAQAEAHRDWTPEQVLADYTEVSGKAVEALAGLQTPGVAETVIPIENAGHYPLHMVANAFSFDHYCHLRNDILRPMGPIDRPAPPSDALRLAAAMEWLIAGLPQMSAGRLGAAATKPLALHLQGPGGGEWTIVPAVDAGPATVVTGSAADAAATVTSTASDFIVWATKRRPWRDRQIGIDGDEGLATSVLDAIHLF
jgi:uncharacterized protein (TIGR03083 family)